MKRWVDLYRQHTELRTRGDIELHAIRKRLLQLAERGHCDRTVQGRFKEQKNGDRRAWKLVGPSGDEGEPLIDLPELPRAHLSVRAISNARTHELQQFSVVLEGEPENGRTWLVGVHLEGSSGPDGDQKGLGACSHAAFHCHVGPSFDALPKVRVPLPALGPVEVLDWVLSIAVPGWDEPAPWARVNEQLRAGAQRPR